MEGTRRFWVLVAASGLLSVLAVVTDRPVLLAGTLAIAGPVIAIQGRFWRSLDRLDRDLDVAVTLGQHHVGTTATVPVTITVSRPVDRACSIGATPVLPATVSATEPARLELDRTTTEEQTTTDLAVAVAGSWTIDGVELVVSDRYGLFRERLKRGAATTITAETASSRSIHVGQGGERTASTLGGHRSGQLGQGIDPVELREYVPGDTVRDIDWKATARLGQPYVREYEVETDRRTVLFVDHRQSLSVGVDGETKLSYLREIALSLTAAARESGDPFGLYAIGDEGTTAEFQPSTNSRHYERLRAALLDLEPTESAATTAATTIGPAEATRRASRVDGSTPFERTLQPYLDARGQYTTRLSENPLFETVRTCRTGLQGTVWSVLLTDDTDRTSVRETVTLARRGPGQVVVFLAPTVLFEPGGLADLETAYEEYRDFEAFRRDLDGMDDVTAFEVGPSDRIDAILATHQGRRR